MFAWRKIEREMLLLTVVLFILLCIHHHNHHPLATLRRLISDRSTRFDNIQEEESEAFRSSLMSMQEVSEEDEDEGKDEDEGERNGST